MKKVNAYIIILHVYQKSQSYDVRFLRYRVRQIFFVIRGHFLPFYHSSPSNDPKNQNLEIKMKKMSGDILLYIHVYHK